MINLNLDRDMKKSVFSASVIMILIMAICLLSWIINIIIISCFSLLAIYMAKDLFFTKNKE